jgi:hypothetical protein
MTDETGGTGAPEPMGTTPPATPETPPNPVQQLLSSGGEGLVTLAGWVLIGTYIVFGLFINEYWIGWLTLLPAVLAVLLPRAGFAHKIAPLPVLLKSVGYIIAILGLFSIVEDLRFATSVFDEFVDILGTLASYAGYVLAYMGARSIAVN